ncbi:MMP13 Collagenase, partial [Acromyrmex insinuator]
MNNAIFGKTMENIRDHVDIRLITGWEIRCGSDDKPNFHRRSIFSENLFVVELRKLEIKLNKSIYVGMCILEISKLRLYEFHFEYIIPLYRDKCKIIFDTSDYPERNAYDISRVNNKIRLARGDRGINRLDAACREHDIAYWRSNDLADRYIADRVLAERACERITANDSTFDEKAAATAVWAAMKAKTKLGMGMKTTSGNENEGFLPILPMLGAFGFLKILLSGITTNEQLTRAAYRLRLPFFRSVFMHDALPTKPHRNESGIINLDNLENAGTHWVVYAKKGNNANVPLRYKLYTLTHVIYLPRNVTNITIRIVDQNEQLINRGEEISIRFHTTQKIKNMLTNERCFEPIFDDRIVKIKTYTYNPYANTTFGYSDEIRTPIQHQDLYTLLCENSVRVRRVKIDRSRNVGITSTIKNFVSLTTSKSITLENAGFNGTVHLFRILLYEDFNFCVPLNTHSWVVKTTSQLEKSRYVIFALQTGKRNVPLQNGSQFDVCNLTNVKLFLNSDFYPYDDMNLDFEHKICKIDRKHNEEICTPSFDGPDGILTHAFYPSNVANYTAEIHVDSADPFIIVLVYLTKKSANNKDYLFNTLTHEIGLALELTHSSREDSIMFAFVTANNNNKIVKLNIEDILAIQQFYGKVNNIVYMVEFQIERRLAKTSFESRISPERFDRTVVNTNRGQTYAIFNNNDVAQIDDCSMSVRSYQLLQAVFPGIPSAPTLAFRYMNSNLYFAKNNNFTNLTSLREP